MCDDSNLVDIPSGDAGERRRVPRPITNAVVLRNTADAWNGDQASGKLQRRCASREACRRLARARAWHHLVVLRFFLGIVWFITRGV